MNMNMNMNIEKLLEELNKTSINNLISLSDNEFREKILNLYNLTNDYTKFLYLELSKHERIQNFIKKLLIKKDYFIKEIIFDNDDIIIISPQELICEDNDWETCWYGSRMDYIGCKKYIIYDLEDGDDNFEVLNSNNENIGYIDSKYCQLGIFTLNEILIYDKEFLNRTYKNYVLIKKFNGIVKSEHDNRGNLQLRGIGNINFLVRNRE